MTIIHEKMYLEFNQQNKNRRLFKTMHHLNRQTKNNRIKYFRSNEEITNN